MLAARRTVGRMGEDTTTNTGTDRVARLRFDFELSDASQLDAMLSSIKNIDSVYDAYRILPGGGS